MRESPSEKNKIPGVQLSKIAAILLPLLSSAPVESAELSDQTGASCISVCNEDTQLGQVCFVPGPGGGGGEPYGEVVVDENLLALLQGEETNKPPMPTLPMLPGRKLCKVQIPPKEAQRVRNLFGLDTSQAPDDAKRNLPPLPTEGTEDEWVR